MHTPGGQVAPTVNGDNLESQIPLFGLVFGASASANTTAVNVDLSSVGGPVSGSLLFVDSARGWRGSALVINPSSQPGVFPIVYRASNAIGDVTISERTVTLRPQAGRCAFANRRIVSPVPGTNIYTYDTRLGDVDGPWTSACFTTTPTGNDVWFRFNATQSGTLSLSTCNSDTGATATQPDTLLGICGRCDDTGFSICGDDVGGCGLGTRLTNIPVVAGQEYNIHVRAFSGDIVNGRLEVTFTPAVVPPT